MKQDVAARNRRFVVIPPRESESESVWEEDAGFDRIYPSWIQRHSRIYWTPVRVARRAAELLALPPGARVLDVGCGVGKFCLVAQQHSPASFFGVECVDRLADIARRAAARLPADRATFLCGDAFDVDWRRFDVLYFFNPFGGEPEEVSPLLSDDDRNSVFRHAVERTYERLAGLLPGARVVLYHGYGGDIPEGFELEIAEWCGTGVLQVWRKT